MGASAKEPGSNRVGTYLVIVVLLAGWIITIGLFSTSYNNQTRANQELAAEGAALRHQLATQTADLQRQLEQVGEKVSAFERYLQNQTAMMSHVMGDVAPLQMPPGWDTEFSRLERIARDEGLRPKDAQTASAFLDDVRKLIADTPAWAEQYHLERLANLRWVGLVFDETSRSPDSTESNYLGNLQSHFDNLLELETIAPSAFDQNIMEHLVAHTERLRDDSVERVRNVSLDKAKRLLGNPGGTDQEITDFLSAYAWLERLNEDTEIKNLKDQLTLRMTQIDAQRQLDEAAQRYESLKQLSESQDDIELLEQGTRLILSELGSARGRLAFEGISMDALDLLYRDVERSLLALQMRHHEQEEKKRTQAIAQYQQLALKMVRDTKAKLEAAKKAAKDNALVYGANWEPAHFKMVVDAMLQLLEVDVRYLDWPLAELHQDTMSEGSAILEMNDKGKGARMRLAERSVSVRKKSLDEFLED